MAHEAITSDVALAFSYLNSVQEPRKALDFFGKLEKTQLSQSLGFIFFASKAVQVAQGKAIEFSTVKFPNVPWLWNASAGTLGKLLEEIELKTKDSPQPDLTFLVSTARIFRENVERELRTSTLTVRIPGPFSSVASHPPNVVFMHPRNSLMTSRAPCKKPRHQPASVSPW